MTSHHFEYNGALSSAESEIAGSESAVALTVSYLARGLVPRLGSQSADELSSLIVASFVGCGTSRRTDRLAPRHHCARFNDRLEEH
jgi:hypothetical protein